MGGQEACQSTVAAAHGIHHSGSAHSAIHHIVDLELSGVAEVLEDGSVFVSNCNSHGIGSFLVQFEIPAAAGNGAGGGSIAKAVIAAGDDQSLSLHHHPGKLAPGGLVDLRHRGAGDLHPLRALAVGQALQIHQADGLIFVQGQRHLRLGFPAHRSKDGIVRKGADPPAALGSWHGHHPPMFSTYVDYTPMVSKCQQVMPIP